jgi:cell division initiation protein
MKLTPLDIRHKEFKRAMRGYADVEVDEFLDEVADEFERIFKENIDLRDRLEVLEDQVAGYKRIEETLQKTLISAQASADELKQNSTREAQLIVHEAELQARQLVNEAYTERQGIEQATARLRSAEQDFRFKFRQLLQGYLAHIEGEAPVTGEPDTAQTDFERRAEAVKQAIEREDGAADAQAPAAPASAAPEREAEGDGGAPAKPEEPSRERDPLLPGPDEVTAGDIAEYMPPPAASDPSRKMPPAERVTLGQPDDLLADVDTGVNENEFKW